MGPDGSKWFILCGEKLKLVWGHPTWPVWTHLKGLDAPKIGSVGPKMAQNAPKWLKKQFEGPNWSERFTLCGKMLKLVWGHPTRPILTHWEDWVPKEWVLEDPQSANMISSVPVFHCLSSMINVWTTKIHHYTYVSEGTVFVPKKG